MMKFSFHRDTWAGPHTIFVLQAEGPNAGQLATPGQIDALLQLLNMPNNLADVPAPYVQGEVDEFLKPSN